jgi:hypothetical protein
LQIMLMATIIFYCKHLVADYQSVQPLAYLLLMIKIAVFASIARVCGIL